MDENNIEVGFIQYKKLFNKNDKKGYPSTFGYCTQIDSSKISLKSARRINAQNNNFTYDAKFSYEFDIKRENGDLDHIDIKLGEDPGLRIWSSQYGFINFYVDMYGLLFNFKSKTENYNVEEFVNFRNGNEKFGHKPEYVYQITYCDKGIELNDDNSIGTTVREISGINNNFFEPSQLKINEKTWVDGRLKINRETEVTGTVQEMAKNIKWE